MEERVAERHLAHFLGRGKRENLDWNEIASIQSLKPMITVLWFCCQQETSILPQWRFVKRAGAFYAYAMNSLIPWHKHTQWFTFENEIRTKVSVKWKPLPFNCTPDNRKREFQKFIMRHLQGTYKAVLGINPSTIFVHLFLNIIWKLNWRQSSKC